MAEMTTYERMKLTYDHKEADRVPIWDWAWPTTVQRWQEQGLPKDMPWEQFFGTENVASIDFDPGPRYKWTILEKGENWYIVRDYLGATMKQFTDHGSTPQHIDSIVKDPESWAETRKRMNPTHDRLHWEGLEEHYPKWRESGAWIRGKLGWSYDIVSARMCNTEMILYGMADDPDWIKDMCEHGVDVGLKIADMAWDAGYTFDELWWFDDMAYKNGLFFSKDMWREMLRPYQKRIVDWAHSHGIKAHLHCCGNINDLIPDLIELGVDVLNPLEVKAGMDPVETKKKYGDSLSLRGGFDVRHWSEPEKIEEEIRRILPEMMENGGYVFASDHSISEDVTVENFRHIVRVVKEVGNYA